MTADVSRFSGRYPHADLSGRIIGAGIAVSNTLRPGLDEKVYENALVVELRHLGLKVDQQRQFPVEYRGVRVGTLIPDLIVENLIIVDTKVVTSFHENHFAQMMGYLAITGLDLALLLNFKHTRLEIKRVVST